MMRQLEAGNEPVGIPELGGKSMESAYVGRGSGKMAIE
jgi:hypothetical protein